MWSTKAFGHYCDFSVRISNLSEIVNSINKMKKSRISEKIS